jgi:hypothetical protein
MSESIRARLVGGVLVVGLLAGAACSSTPSDASVSAGLSADVSLIRTAVASGDRRTAIDLLHRLDSSVDGLAQLSALAPTRVAQIHAAVADVLTALRAARSAPTVTPSPIVTTTPSTSPPPGHAEGQGHAFGHDKKGGGEGD